MEAPVELYGEWSGLDDLYRQYKDMKNELRQLHQVIYQSVQDLSGNSDLSEADLLRQWEKLPGLLRGAKLTHEILPYIHQAILFLVKVMFLYGSDRRVGKKVIRTFIALEKIIAEETKIAMAKHMENLITNKNWSIHNMQTLISLVEVSVSARHGLLCHLEAVLAVVYERLQQQKSSTSWAADLQNHTKVCVKVFLQCVQYLPDSFTPVWLTEEQDLLQELTQNILLHLISLLTDKDTPRDCSLMCGMAAAMSINTAPEGSTAVSALVDLYNILGIQAMDEMCFTKWHRSQNGNCKSHLYRLNQYKQTSSNHISASSENSTFGQLSLLCGTISCTKFELLIHRTDRELPLMFKIFDLILLHCNKGDLYQAVKILSSWYQRLEKQIPQLSDIINVNSVLNSDKAIISRTLDIVWTHLGSPIAGVDEIIIEIVHTLFNVQQKVASESDLSLFFDRVCAQTLQLPWTIKGKYFIMSGLIAKWGLGKHIHELTEVMGSLLNSMSYNYLSPPATNLFRVITDMLCGLNSKNANRPSWREVCMPFILKGLTSDDSLQQSNVNHQWLAWTLKNYPETFDLMQSSLQQQLDTCSDHMTRERLLLSYICFIRSGRANQCSQELEPYMIIREALQHADDDIRLEAVSLVCISPKKSEPLSDIEMTLILDVLPHQMNSDSPPYRQQMQTCVRAVLNRARDSALCLLKAGAKGNRTCETGSGELHKIIDMLNWIWELCLEGLHPGAPYQRMKTCLDWMEVILDVLVYQQGRHQRKGVTPAQAQRLLLCAQEQGKLVLFTARSTQLLLTCVIHGADECKEAASRLLLVFFPWPLPLVTSTISWQEANVAWLNEALRMCNKPKATVAEAGSLLTCLFFERLSAILPGGYATDIIDYNLVVTSTGSGSKTALIDLIRCLMEAANDGYTYGDQRPLEAARQSPGHGFLSAARQCLSKLDVTGTSWDRSVLSELFMYTLDVVRKGVRLMLYNLGGRAQEKDSAPSFEQMGVSLQQALEGQGSGEGVVLSPEHQMLMTWCWLNLKHASLFLATLTEKSTHCDKQVLSEPHMAEIGQDFITILTKCRHRGAIEGCNLGFQKFCSCLLKKSSLYHILQGLMDQILKQVTSSLSSLSVTRRSAGLPLIIQSMVSSEANTGQTRLLQLAVSQCLQVLQLPPPTDPDETVDLPHVHALNILKALFRESSVASSIMQFISPVMIQTINGFSSSFWAIRNASMQLFGSLVNRVFGQKKTQDDQMSSVTVTEFFMQYVELREVISSHVQRACEDQQSGSLRLHSSLFPVLCILARLTAGIKLQEVESITQNLQDKLYLLLSNPVYAVRELAAKALPAFIDQEKVYDYLENVIRGLPANRKECTSMNKLHGTLLLIGHLISCCTSTTVGSLLHEKQWIGTPENPCPLLRAKYTQILDKLGCSKAVTTSQGLTASVQVGGWLLEQHNTKLHLGEQKNMLHTVTSNLTSDNPDRIMATLQQLKNELEKDHKQENGEFWEHVKRILEQHVQRGTSACILQGALDVLAKLHNVQAEGSTGGVWCDRLWRCYIETIISEPNSSGAASALIVAASVISKCCEERTYWLEVCEWSRLVYKGSHFLRTEHVRHSAATCLTIAGKNVMSAANHHRDKLLEEAVSLLLCAALHLLQDDSPDNRRETSRFVTRVTSRQENSVQNAVSVRLLLDHVVEQFSWSSLITECLLDDVLLYSSTALILKQEVEQQHLKNCTELFEAEDTNGFMDWLSHVKAIRNSCKAAKQSQAISLTWHQSRTKHLHDEWSRILTLCQRNFSGDTPVNASWSKRGFLGLYSLLAFTDLVCHLGTKIGTSLIESTFSQNNCKLFLNLPNLHLKLEGIPGVFGSQDLPSTD